jgi:hypothetical protein
MNITIKPLMKCRVCGSELQVYEKLTRIPTDGTRFTRTICCEVEFYDSDLYSCPLCELYQISDLENFSDFYNFSNTKYIDSMNKERLSLFNELLLFSERQESILGIEDVGFSQKICVNGKKLLTINPEQLCKKGGGENNHFILEECSMAGFMPENCFDIFYTICPLAHVDNPLTVMKDINTLLKEGGVGWIEVLNGSALVNESQYYNFMPILLNYWTPLSLTKLLQLSGFETLLIKHGLGGDELNVIFKKPLKRMPLMHKRDFQANSILDIVKKHKKTVIWGAGAKGHYLFSSFSDRLKVSHIVDTNPEKHGLYMPGASLCVEPPSKDIFLNADLVIIFAASHEKEIKKILHEEYGYKGEIFCLTEN